MGAQPNGSSEEDRATTTSEKQTEGRAGDAAFGEHSFSPVDDVNTRQQDQLRSLEMIYSRYSFRYRPDAQCACLRWQCGVAQTQTFQIRHRNGKGGSVKMEEELFSLIFFASSYEELLKQLSKL